MEARHIFIINPAAGRRDSSAETVRSIESACARQGVDYDIYLTSYPAHATEIVKRTAQIHADTPLAFYACGGDGTLSEVANGIVSLERTDCAFTSYPVGTGNDYIKMFKGGKSAFLDLDRLMRGSPMDIDCIASDCGCSINILSVGLDAEVSMRMGKYRFLGGGIVPYAMSALESVIRGIGREYRVNIDGKEYDGNYSIIFIGNGRFYGGGFCPVPDSRIDDGILDVLLVDRLTRMQAAALVGKYKNGRYRELDKYIRYLQAKTITIYSKDNSDMCINIDGETVRSSRIGIRMEARSLSFIVPEGSGVIE